MLCRLNWSEEEDEGNRAGTESLVNGLCTNGTTTGLLHVCINEPQRKRVTTSFPNLPPPPKNLNPCTDLEYPAPPP